MSDGSRIGTDVVIVGASVAGCTAATLLGRQGVRVTLLEKTTKPDHYKVVCGHYIQAGGTPVIRRLGLAEPMEAAGAVRNGLEVWTRYGWYRPEGDLHYGYNLRRSRLDPMLREMAAAAPNVELRRGVTVTGITRDEAGRPSGVTGRTPKGERVEVAARVVVGADGRTATVARLAGVPGRVRAHGRFAYMRYFTGIELDAPDDRTMFWFRDRDVLYAFPNEDGVVAMAAFLHNDHLPAFKADKDEAHYATFEGLPRAPRLREATPISPLIGKLDMPNVMRPAARPGVAFVGDAAQASDPVWGVGIGFAFQSAEWLADEIAGPLLAGGDVDAALERYRRRHLRFMALHHWTMSDYATGRPFNLMDKIIHKGATRDARTARLVHRMGSREEPLDHVLRPRGIARAARAAVAR